MEALSEAVRDGEWSTVTKLVESGVQPTDVSEVLNEAVVARQWDCVTAVARHCLESRLRPATESASVQGPADHWALCQELLPFLSVEACSELFSEAADAGRWDVVQGVMAKEVTPSDRVKVALAVFRSQHAGVMLELVQSGMLLRPRETAVDNAAPQQVATLIILKSCSVQLHLLMFLCVCVFLIKQQRTVSIEYWCRRDKLLL